MNHSLKPAFLHAFSCLALFLVYSCQESDELPVALAESQVEAGAATRKLFHHAKGVLEKAQRYEKIINH